MRHGVGRVRPEDQVPSEFAVDEMAGLHLQVVPVRESDLEELSQALWGRMMRSLGGGVYRSPGN